MMFPLGSWLISAVLASAPLGGPLTVSAAVSLTDSLDAIAAAYTAGGGGRVRFNFAGSNVLARQIVNGAPVDVFISADDAQMDVAARSGAIDPSSRIPVVSNRLAVIVRSDTALRHSIQTVRDLLSDDVRRIAIGDPSAVPAGVYARTYLQAVGVWEALRRKVVPVANVRAAVAVVDNGSADAAIVYVSDAGLSKTAATAFVVSDPRAPRILYPAAIASRSRQKGEAQRFLAFLRGAEASAIFRHYGLAPVADGQ